MCLTLEQKSEIRRRVQADFLPAPEPSRRREHPDVAIEHKRQATLARIEWLLDAERRDAEIATAKETERQRRISQSVIAEFLDGGNRLDLRRKYDMSINDLEKMIRTNTTLEQRRQREAKTHARRQQAQAERRRAGMAPTRGRYGPRCVAIVVEGKPYPSLHSAMRELELTKSQLLRKAVLA